MRVARREVYAGWALLVALIAITILPFISIFTTALYPSGSAPVGLSFPADPQWGNFLEAFKVANMMAVENEASRRVAERAGATFEGTLRHRILLHGVYHDAHLYSLIRTEIA